MTDRYENIRKALAMGPTPGPWEPVTDRQYSDLPYLVVGAGASDVKSTEWMPLYVHVGGRSGWMEQKANTLLIAACDPDTSRALLEERDALAATLAATEAARDGYRDDARQLHAALVRMVAQYEFEFDHEDTHKFRPEWLREALARTNALQEGGEEPEALRQNAASVQPELAAVALAACDAVDELIEKWYATRESGCLPNQVVRAMGASKLLRAIALEESK